MPISATPNAETNDMPCGIIACGLAWKCDHEPLPMANPKMAMFVIFGFAIGNGSWSHFHASPQAMMPHGMSFVSAFGVALIGIFFAYDGWVYIGQAAGEVQRPERNLPLALIGGVLLVMAIYVS